MWITFLTQIRYDGARRTLGAINSTPSSDGATDFSKTAAHGTIINVDVFYTEWSIPRGSCEQFWHEIIVSQRVCVRSCSLSFQGLLSLLQLFPVNGRDGRLKQIEANSLVKIQLITTSPSGPTALLFPAIWESLFRFLTQRSSRFGCCNQSSSI